VKAPRHLIVETQWHECQQGNSPKLPSHPFSDEGEIQSILQGRGERLLEGLQVGHQAVIQKWHELTAGLTADRCHDAGRESKFTASC